MSCQRFLGKNLTEFRKHAQRSNKAHCYDDSYAVGPKFELTMEVQKGMLRKMV